MEAAQVIDSISQTTTRRPRPPAPRSTGGAQRHPVDFKDRGALEGPAGEIPAIPDVPSPVPGVGSSWRSGGDTPGLSRGLTGAWRDRHPRGLYRRHFRAGKKGGSGVGKTRRGKGTKIIAVADAAGLPVAAHVESAPMKATRKGFYLDDYRPVFKSISLSP
jgi:hypothetical protein